MELDRTDWCNLVPSCSTDPPVAHGLAILWFSEDLLIAPVGWTQTLKIPLNFKDSVRVDWPDRFGPVTVDP